MPEQDDPKPDEFEDLAQLHRRSKEEAEAWQKFLECMKKLKVGPEGQPKQANPENKAE